MPLEMNNVELRWVSRRADPCHRTRELQYRTYTDVGGPYPNYQWSDWIDVPVVNIDEPSEPITAEAVKHLRDISDCPMMDCKKALTATNGDMNKAVEWLRTNRNRWSIR